MGPDGKMVPFQQVGPEDVLFEARTVPPMGYAVYRVVEEKAAIEQPSEFRISEKGIENAFVRIKLDKNGSLSSVYDKADGRELLPKGQRGNVLQLFEDPPAQQ